MAPGCLDALFEALAALPSSAVSLADAAAIFRTPPGLRNAPGFAAVLKTAGGVLLQRFGDVFELLSSPALVAQLLLLPQAALLYLLSSNALLTDCEDSVLVMVSWWLEGVVGRGCSEEDVTQLRAKIRYSRLSSTYLVQVLRRLPRLRPTERQLLELLGYQALKATLVLDYFKDAGDGLMPDGWLKPCRTPSDRSNNSVTTSLDVSQAVLETHIAGLKAAMATTGVPPDFPPQIKSLSKLCSGFVVFLYFGSAKHGQISSPECTDGSAGSFVSGIEICAPLPAYGDHMTLPRGVPCSMSISILGHQKRYRKSSPESCLCSKVRLRNFPQMVSKLPGNPLSLSWWAPLLKDGSLCLSATVHIEV